MSLTLKKEKRQNLSNLKVFVEDNSLFSPNYFKVSDVPQILQKGKNLLRIKGSSDNLVAGSQILIDVRDANGNEAQKTLVPTIDPYQQQSTIIAMRYGYRIDGFTEIKISSVLANATVKLYFYPSDNINLARGLSGRPVSEAFGNPGIVKAQTIKLQG